MANKAGVNVGSPTPFAQTRERVRKAILQHYNVRFVASGVQRS